jgi:energy-coupling factor transporter ATP-binding protein EcfA2
MFKRIELEGYKAWRKVDVELRPLTLILGANSSGKSSLLQPLLLLKQTFESPNPRVHLNLGGRPGDLVSVGPFSSLLSMPTTTNEFSVRVEFGLGEPADLPYVAFHDVTYTEASGAGVVAELRCGTDRGDTPREEMIEVGVERSREGRYGTLSPELRVNATKRESDTSLEPFRSLPPPGADWGSVGGTPPEEPSDDYGYRVSDYTDAIIHQFSLLHYLGPLRETPQRDYRPVGRQTDVGPKGEGAIELLLTNPDADNSLLRRTSQWARRFGIADELRAGELGARYRDLLMVRGGIETSLADVGFGVGQILPVLVQTLTANEPDTVLMFEEPESHIHPAVQADLADLFIEALGRQMQVIVETHSEHLLRRVQRRIAEGAIRADDVAIYFCSSPREGGGSNIERLQVDTGGNISNWPRDFFGDRMSDLVAMTKAAAKRARPE